MLRLLIETCVHRRVAALFATLVVAVFGFRAYLETPIEAYPDVTNTQVTVITPVPRQRAGGDRAPHHGAARARVERHAGHDADAQRKPVRPFADHADVFGRRRPASPRARWSLQRVAAAELPAGVTPELAPEATPLGEVYQFRITSDRHDLYQLRSEMQWNVVRVLRQVPGVADIVPFGGFLKEMHVRVDPARLFSLGFSLTDVEQALAKSNLNVGGGFLRRTATRSSRCAASAISNRRKTSSASSCSSKDGTRGDHRRRGDRRAVVHATARRRRRRAREGRHRELRLDAARPEPVGGARRHTREDPRAERDDPAERHGDRSVSTTAAISSA